MSDALSANTTLGAALMATNAPTAANKGLRIFNLCIA
jgi:hypothetical protein